MSQGNVEIVRRAYEELNRGDLDAAVVDVAPDAEYIPSEAFPEAEVRRGPEGIKSFLGWLLDEFEGARVEPNELVAAGDKVLVSSTITGRGRRSGAETNWDVWHVWELRAGKISAPRPTSTGTRRSKRRASSGRGRGITRKLTRFR
jgi:ketosteroid isomerase-like protein